MVKRLEKRWADFDQPFFVIALVLNPYEKLSRFGDAAGVQIFALHAVFMELYRRVHFRPIPETLSEAEHNIILTQKSQKETMVSSAFLQYLGENSQHFSPFYDQCDEFWKLHGDNPVLVWRQFLPVPEIWELVDFAILILGIVVNSDGTERVFSDLKIKRARLRNRLSFKKRRRCQRYVGTSIQAEHLAEGLRKQREPRKNHDVKRVAELIAVPKYADLLEQNEDVDADSDGAEAVKAAWRKVYTHWLVSARQEEMAAEESGEAYEPSVPELMRNEQTIYIKTRLDTQNEKWAHQRVFDGGPAQTATKPSWGVYKHTRAEE
ncbi:hypothetical protein R3P38DRAFT_2787161 [Favolaschia claudopus]|uniref:HAT C-terminal dimerisation domain-containing protein n=1 Tax=Favolaschia claudopus TaxID=2862362 RepID=A0AAW0APZ9_9AGAR